MNEEEKREEGGYEGGEGHTILFNVDMQMRKTFLCLPSLLLAFKCECNLDR